MTGFSTEHFLPGVGDDVELVPVELLGESGGSRVANRQALAVGRNEVAILDADARCRAVPREDDVMIEVEARQINDLAIVGDDRARILQLQMLDDVDHPMFAECFPGDDVDGPRAEQRPQGRLDGAGVGAGHDGDAIIGRNLQNFAGQLNGLLQPGFADSGAMGAASAERSQGF